jgi:hypothetical protein
MTASPKTESWLKSAGEANVTKLHVYQLTAPEFLEDRTVLAGQVGLGLPVLFAPSFSIPAAVSNLSTVQQDFGNFVHSYLSAVQNVLLARGPDGTINTSVNLAAFDRAVSAALESLTSSLIQDVSNLPAAPALDTAITNAILGPAPDSLQNRLADLTVPIIVQAPSFAGFIQDASLLIHGPAKPSTLEQLGPIPPPTVPSGIGDIAPPSFPAKFVGFSAGTIAQVRVRQAYSAFLQDYFTTAKTVLFAPGPDGSIDPVSNRKAFDARVAAGLKTLADDLASTAGGLPSGATLIGQMRQAITGPHASSLQNRLAALPTPTSAEALMVKVFGFDSSQAIGSSLALISGDVAAFVRGTGPGH